jgi:hypothetical protein
MEEHKAFIALNRYDNKNASDNPTISTTIKMRNLGYISVCCLYKMLR